MEDLIKRSDAIKAMEQRYQEILRIFKRKVKVGEKAVVLDMIGCVKSLPSADRPQGEWIHNPNGIDRDFIWWKCSECGHVIYSESEHDREEFHAFCGRCGARMKGADDDTKDG